MTAELKDSRNKKVLQFGHEEQYSRMPQRETGAGFFHSSSNALQLRGTIVMLAGLKSHDNMLVICFMPPVKPISPLAAGAPG